MTWLRDPAAVGMQLPLACSMSCVTVGCIWCGVIEIPGAVAAELARLRAENARLLRMLELSPRQAAPPGPAQAGFFDCVPVRRRC
jgi:hypothetical protein